MTTDRLIYMAGLAALLGGVLRILAAFVPFEPGLVGLETFYALIDIALLAGLTAFYVLRSEALGALGFAGFLVTFTGLALITGPDGMFAGMDMYEFGVLVIAAGLVLMSIQIVRRRISPVWTGYAWLAAPVLSIAGDAAGYPDRGFIAAGIAFGLGFIGVGLALLAPPAAQPA